MMYSKGQVVLSIAGRDKGTFLIILAIEGDCAILVDGKARPINRPKKKKLKHIQATKTLAENVDVMTNREIRRILHPFNYGE